MLHIIQMLLCTLEFSLFYSSIDKKQFEAFSIDVICEWTFKQKTSPIVYIDSTGVNSKKLVSKENKKARNCLLRFVFLTHSYIICVLK